MVRQGPRIPEASSQEQEAELYRSLSAAQRAELLVAACRAAAALLRAHADPERAAGYVDPLSESTRRALARLRREASVRRTERSDTE
jgi:Mg/Co/Ni transporter MgtE